MTSFLGRLAAWNGLGTRRFALDMGISWNRLVVGDDEAVARVAHLVGMPVQPLLDSAFRLVDGRWSWAGERIVPGMLRRAQVRVCPRCLAQDADVAHHLASTTWQRAVWCLAPVLTCPDHGTELVEVAHVEERGRLHDFSFALASVLARLDELAASAPHRRPSGLQDYLLGRKEGRQGMPWLDAMPWYVVSETTRLMGTVALWGRDMRRRDLSSMEDRHAADDAGFVVVSGGERGIVDLLEHQLRTFDHPTSNNCNHRGVFPTLVQALDGVADKVDFEAVREVVGRFVTDRFPLPPGEYLGVRLERRRLRTVTSLAEEIGIKQKILRSVLVAQGVVPAGDATTACGSIVVDAQENRDLMDRLASRIPARRATALLGVSIKTFGLLVEAGLIRPFAGSSSRRGRMDLFLVADIEEFVGRLLGSAEPCGRAPPGFVPLFVAARMCGCRLSEILSLVLAGSPVGLRRRRGMDGLRSLLVDPVAVWKLKAKPHRDGVTLGEICDLWKVSWRTARCLRDAGMLVAMSGSSGPGAGLPRFDAEAAGAFLDRHATVAKLASEFGCDSARLRRRLVADGVRPVLDPVRHGVGMYRRSEVTECWRGGGAGHPPGGVGR